ncbi:hypothetical protein PTSG_08836 [Salpingoeca rosetta]|uniref:Uncharacterized protein n=1 Tax=Salpingoeca rosetta (strain ATCC 50818 / BSB-021) TaxID=946362 RepID=F2UKU8_SALR5|nr:uncharacterized protein PTSG_08836 [Salpingoeca rosetta]EGD77747.1 hypothetical protein PTSG_08836 [Salpingoeca rosetta]|eukprot:XP_004990223.1 hypothetical protein PTSG_08836 [Salpingoeca rosetta]
MMPRRTSSSSSSSSSSSRLVVVLTTTCTLLLAVWQWDTCSSEVVLEEDGSGTFHINTTDSQPVFVNGINVDEMFQAIYQNQLSIQQQVALNDAQALHISQLQARLCDLAEPEPSVSTIDAFPPNAEPDPGDGDVIGPVIGTPLVRDNRWSGGVLADNGLIYGIPLHANAPLILDPETGTVDNPLSDSAVYKWSGGVLGSNGLIYGFPFFEPSVLVIDPATNATGTIPLNMSTSFSGDEGDGMWQSGILASNGLIFAIPDIAGAVLVIDPATNATDMTTMAGLDDGSWFGAVQAPNDLIYSVPSTASSVLIINPFSKTTDTTSIVVRRNGDTGTWAGTVLAENGLIYGIPSTATKVLVVNPGTKEMNIISIPDVSTAAKWRGGVLSPTGLIVGIPQHASSVLLIDPALDTVDTTTLSGLSSGSFYWSGGVLANNGRIYGIPTRARTILVIHPRGQMC